MQLSIEQKTVLVTGANRGIGRSIVETFLERGAAKIYAAVRNLDTARPLVETYQDKVVPLLIDLEDPKTVVTASYTSADVDIVVNNAGILHASSPLADEAYSDLLKEMEINVGGLLHMARVYAPILKANGGGAFVQLNSIASVKNFADFSTYSASKAAAYSLTQGLREKLASQNTLVVSVHPGPIATDMAKKVGFDQFADPPRVVADAIIDALQSGQFHVFPDTMARQIWEQYHSFAKQIVEQDLDAG